MGRRFKRDRRDSGAQGDRARTIGARWRRSHTDNGLAAPGPRCRRRLGRGRMAVRRRDSAARASIQAYLHRPAAKPDGGAFGDEPGAPLVRRDLGMRTEKEVGDMPVKCRLIAWTAAYTADYAKAVKAIRAHINSDAPSA